GRPQVIETRLQRSGLRIRPLQSFEVINPEVDPRFREYVALYLSLVGRHCVTPQATRTIVRPHHTAIRTLSLRRGEDDALL
ncbi:phosphate acyltransferase, partial [Rhizobium leguminosarum]|uniref:phosphate acyltransferase n=1 Tax=Rhizobium leguminosarum TaxID=384 RepID=UPI003F9E5544